MASTAADDYKGQPMDWIHMIHKYGELQVDGITANGETLGKNLEQAAVKNRDVIFSLDNPREAEGGITVVSGNPAHYLIVPGMTISELIKQLSIPVEIELTAFINGKYVALDSHLQGNEEVKLFPLTEGG